MKASINKATKADIYELIRSYGEGKFTPGEVAFFKRCVSSAAQVYIGFIDGEITCFWGLVPPTLLSDHAYLWLYTTEGLAGHEFLFVRQSQVALQQMLKEWPIITGHVLAQNTKAIRWLRWLGAEFIPTEGAVIPFTIRRK